MLKRKSEHIGAKTKLILALKQAVDDTKIVQLCQDGIFCCQNIYCITN